MCKTPKLHLSYNSDVKHKNDYIRAACGIKKDNYAMPCGSFIVDWLTFYHEDRFPKCKKCLKKFEKIIKKYGTVTVKEQNSD